MEIERENPDRGTIRKYEVIDTFYKNLRCFFVAGAYFTVGKQLECLSLLNYLQNNVEQQLKEKSLVDNLDLNRENITLLNVIKCLRSKWMVLMYEKKAQEEAVIEEKMIGLNIEGKKASQVELVYFFLLK